MLMFFTDLNLRNLSNIELGVIVDGCGYNFRGFDLFWKFLSPEIALYIHKFSIELYFQAWADAPTVHPPLSFLLRGKVAPPTKFSKMGGLTGSQFLERDCWERGGDFFQGNWLQFLHKE